MYEPLQPLCKNVATQAGIPEAWNALRGRVQRMQRNASAEAESERTQATRVRRMQSNASAEAESGRTRRIGRKLRSISGQPGQCFVTPSPSRSRK